MEPVSTTIVAAIAGGAAVAFKDVANKAVSDAYQGIRTLIVERYKRKASLEALEEDSESAAAQQLLAAALEKTEAVKDGELLQLAQTLSGALSQIPQTEATSYAIDIERFKAAEVLFRNIQSSGIGIRIGRAEVEGKFVIEDVKAGLQGEDAKKN
jgi:hypothetical protein